MDYRSPENIYLVGSLIHFFELKLLQKDQYIYLHLESPGFNLYDTLELQWFRKKDMVLVLFHAEPLAVLPSATELNQLLKDTSETAVTKGFFYVLTPKWLIQYRLNPGLQLVPTPTIPLAPVTQPFLTKKQVEERIREVKTLSGVPVFEYKVIVF